MKGRFIFKKIICSVLFLLPISSCIAQELSVEYLKNNSKKYYNNGWYMLDVLNKPFSATFYDDFSVHTENDYIPYLNIPCLTEDTKKFWFLRDYIPEENISSIQIDNNRLKVNFYDKGRSKVLLKFCPYDLSQCDFDIRMKVDKKTNALFTGIVLGDLNTGYYSSITFSTYLNIKRMIYERFEDGIITFSNVENDIYIEENSNNYLRIKKENTNYTVYVNDYKVYDLPESLISGKNIGLIAAGDKDFDKAIFKEFYANIVLNNHSIKQDTLKNVVSVKKLNGVYSVPVILNGVLKIDFIFDSGASDVSISPDIALTLIKTGTIKPQDWLEGVYYKFANGSTAKSSRFKLESLTIGTKTLKNIICSISNSIEAPMLLGQGVLNKFGKYTFDNVNKKLELE